MTGPLENMTVLVTRPAHQAEGFCRLVEEAGGRPVRLPVIEIEALSLTEPEYAALQQPSDCLIFISANAVRIGIDIINRNFPGRLQASRIMAIGRATGSELERHGIEPDLVPPSPYNSEALLAMPEMKTISGRSYTIIKGSGGRDYLAEQLRLRGGRVRGIDVYQRVKPQMDADVLTMFSKSDIAVVAITSVRGLHFLFEMATTRQREWLQANARFLVPGKRVADAVRDLHIRQAPIVAENATDEAMLSRLIDAA